MSDLAVVALFAAWLTSMTWLFVYALNGYLDGPFDRTSKRTWLGRIDGGE